MAAGGEELEQIQDIGKGQTFNELAIKARENLTPNQQVKEQLLTAPPMSKELINSHIAGAFAARPINTVDTFGVRATISNANVLIDPASIPILFTYEVHVPTGRTYILRNFYFVPTRFLYDTNNNPIQDLFELTFFVNDAPVNENSNMIFPAWGTGGYVNAYFIAPANSTIKLVAKITNPAYVTTGLPFPVYMGASIAMQFNALLDNGAPANLQPGNITDDMNTLNQQHTKTTPLSGMVFGKREYVRPSK